MRNATGFADKLLEYLYVRACMCVCVCACVRACVFVRDYKLLFAILDRGTMSHQYLNALWFRYNGRIKIRM